jgi:hypothetical protein
MRGVMVIIGRDIKLRLLLVILSVIILFPDTSYAHVTRFFDGFAIVSPFIIVVVNFFKFLIIAQFNSHNNTKKLFNLILSVAAAEIFLIFVVYCIALAFLSIFNITNHEIEEIHIFFLMIISFGIIAIAPNILLVKDEKQEFSKAIAIPKTFICAAMLAFITPSVETALVILSSLNIL